TEAMGGATARRCEGLAEVLIVVDGSSVTLTDDTGDKDFGVVGTFSHGRRGLKVITALAVDLDGVPLGVLDQEYWVRTTRQMEPSEKRKVSDTETQRWLDTVMSSFERLRTEAAGARPCVVVDREADNHHILSALDEASIDFIIRSSFDRRLVDAEGRA